mgnify:CR=1 FL=1
MDNNDIHIFDKNIIDLVKKQTDYTEDKVKQKLIEWNNDHICVIKEYINPNFNKKKPKEEKKTTNEMIWKEIRTFMDGIKPLQVKKL